MKWGALIRRHALHQSHLSVGTLGVWRQMKRAVNASARAPNSQRATRPVGPARVNTTLITQDKRPMNGGADGLSHSLMAPQIAKRANPASTRTNQRVSFAPVRRVIGFMMPNVEGEGPPERRSRGGNRQALLAGGPSRLMGWTPPALSASWCHARVCGGLEQTETGGVRNEYYYRRR